MGGLAELIIPEPGELGLPPAAWDLSCLDWEDRIRKRLPLISRELHLFSDPADKAVNIFNRLRLPDVEKKPKIETAAGDWFRDIVRTLFGSLDPVINERIIREVFCLAPKKSAKTTYGAALMLTALLMNTRPRAEYLLIAPSKLIADGAFSQILGMIEADDEFQRSIDGTEGMLKRRLHVKDYHKEIIDRRSKAKLLIKAFDTNVLTGVKPVGTMIDELHEIAKDSAAERILRQVRGGSLANPEGFLFFITTQSDVEPFGVFLSELTAARAVRDGKSNYPMLPVLYEFPLEIAKDEELWSDPRNWGMVNPNIDRSFSLQRLITDYGKAKDDGKSALAIWVSQHLNIEIGQGLNRDRWVGADFWEKNGEFGPKTLEELIERSEVIVVGIDGGGLDDLLGFAALGREKGTGKWLLWSHAWAHKIVLERRKGEASKLRTFESQGHLTIVESPGDDVIQVADLVMQIEESGLLAEEKAIGVDAAGITDIVEELTSEERGIDIERILGVSQGWQLNGAIKTTERRLAGGLLLHGGFPLMGYAVANAKPEPKGNAVTITKAVAGSAKIDPLMAALNAVSLMARGPKSRRSVYEDEDVAV